jgi:hypothetical protein
MMINGSVRIELDHSQQAETLVSILMQDYASIATSVAETIRESEKRPLQAFEKDDMSDMLYTLEAMDRVLQNYMIPDLYDTWRKAWKKTHVLYDRVV